MGANCSTTYTAVSQGRQLGKKDKNGQPNNKDDPEGGSNNKYGQAGNNTDGKEEGERGGQRNQARPVKANSASLSSDPRPNSHVKCLNSLYPKTEDVSRFHVPDNKVSWNQKFPEYEPREFFAIQEVPIEEDEDFREGEKEVNWNADDGHVNRVSHQGGYEIVDGIPRNPIGRTGIHGRGRLARWGPNHAADPIVTRWKRNAEDQLIKDQKSQKGILQFIAIVRGDSGEWAIPGGFVDSGEEVYNTLKREFCEEAMDSEKWTKEEKSDFEAKINHMFDGGDEVYRGYVDDPRNTDNSWIETVAVNFHDDTGKIVGKLQLAAGDDAVGVQWRDVGSNLKLYASHKDFIQMVAKLRDSHW